MGLKLLTAGMASLLALLLAEGILRLFAPQPPSWMSIYRRHPRLPFFSLQPDVSTTVDTGETHWVIETDSFGCRTTTSHPSPSRPADGPPPPLALWLGDSYTFGHGVDHDESFVGLLEEHCGGDYQFINSSVPNYGPTQYLQVLEDALRHATPAPNLVLVGTYLGNDFYDCEWSKDQPVVDGIIGNDQSLKSWIKRRSHLYRLASKAFHQWARKSHRPRSLIERMYQPAAWESGILHDSLSTYRQAFAEITSLCSERGLPLLVVVIPPRESIEREQLQGPGIHPDLPVDRALAILESLAIDTLDLRRSLLEHDTRDTFFRFDGHLTPMGHRLVAEQIQARLPSSVE